MRVVRDLNQAWTYRLRPALLNPEARVQIETTRARWQQVLRKVSNYPHC
jgi:hypothetical protein